MFNVIDGDYHWIFLISYLKLVDRPTLLFWRSLATPHITLLLDPSGSSSSNFYISISSPCPPKVKLSGQQTFKHIQFLFPLFFTHQVHQIQKNKVSRIFKAPTVIFIHSLVPKAKDYQNFVTFLYRNNFCNCLYHCWVRASILLGVGGGRKTVQVIFPWNSIRQINKKKSENLCKAISPNTFKKNVQEFSQTQN